MARKRHRVGVVITAGGRGMRFGGVVPKQFLLLDGKPVVRHSIEQFESLDEIDEIIVVVPADETRRAETIIAGAGFRKISHVVVGGSERQHSVRNGLLCFDVEPEIVLVHDAVRPLVSEEVIRAVIRQSRKHGAAVVGVRVKDTTRFGEKGFYSKTLERDKLWSVQTPQGFRFGVLMRAHIAAQRAAFLGTDEASLVERLKIPVKIVEGEYRNIKITTLDDLHVAKLLMKTG